MLVRNRDSIFQILIPFTTANNKSRHERDLYLLTYHPIQQVLITKFIKYRNKVLCDYLCRAAFYLVALYHAYQLPIFK